MTIEYSYTAIAIFVPPPNREKLAACSRLLSEKHKSWFVLNEIEFPPHITIWIAYVPTHNLDAISHAVQDVVCNLGDIAITVSNVKIEDSGYVALEVELTQKLRDLHNLLLTHLNRFREGYLSPKYVATLHTFSQEQQESLKMYGTRAAGSLFAPHLTIGIVPADSVPAIRQDLVPVLEEMRQIQFQSGELIFFRQDKPGKSVKVLNRYQLG